MFKDSSSQKDKARFTKAYQDEAMNEPNEIQSLHAPWTSVLGRLAAIQDAVAAQKQSLGSLPGWVEP